MERFTLRKYQEKPNRNVINRCGETVIIDGINWLRMGFGEPDIKIVKYHRLTDTYIGLYSVVADTGKCRTSGRDSWKDLFFND